MDKKILERVEKLLKLGDPSKNNSIHECHSAAVEACKLIAEHDLVVKPREAKRRVVRSRQTNPYPPQQPSYSTWGAQGSTPPGWAKSRAARDGVCEDPECQGPIYRGDSVWARIVGFDTQYLHMGGDCGW